MVDGVESIEALELRVNLLWHSFREWALMNTIDNWSVRRWSNWTSWTRVSKGQLHTLKGTSQYDSISNNTGSWWRLSFLVQSFPPGHCRQRVSRYQDQDPASKLIAQDWWSYKCHQVILNVAMVRTVIVPKLIIRRTRSCSKREDVSFIPSTFCLPRHRCSCNPYQLSSQTPTDSIGDSYFSSTGIPFLGSRSSLSCGRLCKLRSDSGKVCKKSSFSSEWSQDSACVWCGVLCYHCSVWYISCRWRSKKSWKQYQVSFNDSAQFTTYLWISGTVGNTGISIETVGWCWWFNTSTSRFLWNAPEPSAIDHMWQTADLVYQTLLFSSIITFPTFVHPYCNHNLSPSARLVDLLFSESLHSRHCRGATWNQNCSAVLFKLSHRLWRWLAQTKLLYSAHS